MKSIHTFTAEIGSEAYIAGRTEDGRDFVAERFFVTVSNDYGLRYRHKVSFNGTVPEYGDYGTACFPDLRDNAVAFAEKLRAKVAQALRNGQALDLSRWYEDAPVYGSDYYLDSGVEADRAFADREAA